MFIQEDPSQVTLTLIYVISLNNQKVLVVHYLLKTY